MKKNKEGSCNTASCRLNKVGGQAVLEGVMMKAGDRTVTTCRKEDGSMVVTDDSFVSVRKKHKILNIPILRGVVNFVEMMILSFKTLGASADALGLEEEEPSGFEKWLSEKLGIGITSIVMAVALVLGLGLSLLLFMFLPIWITAGLGALLSLGGIVMHPVITAVVEGVMKVAIFLAYLSLVALMPDIKRTFMYHGAEHKSIACFEAGDELTPENAAKHRRFHPRCGTSFMFLMIALGIFAGVFVKLTFPGLNTFYYTLIRLALLPLVMGIGYEIIMIAGKHDNIITRIISAPGLWVQRITTKEPTLDMLEVAIVSIKCALRQDFPEFMEFYESRSWEKKDECEIEAATNTVDEDAEAIACAEDGEVKATVEAVGTVAAEAGTEVVVESTAEEATADAAISAEDKNDA